ncbi:MAG: LacI family DNA-binding transcriptional regulator [Anaerolineae bacterium]|nr:LacI family DNA-binding transcriptional regulator [Anaerolineae bacterium]
MTKSRVSIKDIARTAGVAHSTVSRALNNNPLISPETRARIQSLAEEMGYIPNAVAQSLQTRHSDTIGLVVASLSDPFFGDVIEGVDEVASEAGLSIFVTASHNDPERELEVIEMFHRRRVDGIIVAASRLSNHYTARLKRIRVPVVLVNHQAVEEQTLFASVAVDNHRGAWLAVNHLLALGHTQIGYLGLGNRQRSDQQRLAGYQDALAGAKLPLPVQYVLIIPADVVQASGDVEAGRIYFPQLLATGVTAIFCYNDRVAVGALLACHQQGIAVPKVCSLVGFDDIDMAQYITPPLTTIRQPRRTMGQRAMRMVLDLLNEQEVENQLIAPELVCRESTRRCVKRDMSNVIRNSYREELCHQK